MIFFVDANILIYAMDSNNPQKSKAANALLREIGRERLLVLNLQVLNETTNVLLKRSAFTIDQIRDYIDGLRAFGDDPLDTPTVELGWVAREATGYQWWDCLLLASAHRKRCRYFLTEDMQHERTVLDVTIINPFVTAPLDLPLPN